MDLPLSKPPRWIDRRKLAAPERQEVASLVRIAPHRRAIPTSWTGFRPCSAAGG